jgi:DNA-binding transcriptional ArsR family regulator
MGATAELMQRGGKRRQKSMLAAAVSHPLRTRIFAILGERVASPIEISRELNEDVSNVGYHIRGLVAWDLVEEVDSRPVRGSTEHFFRAVETPGLTDEEEQTMWPEERRSYGETILSLFTRDAVRSLDEGLLYERTDHYLTRFVHDTDEQGWNEAVQAYAECFERVKKIEIAAAERLEKKRQVETANKESKWRPIRMLSFLGLFEVPQLRTTNMPPPDLSPLKP